MNVPGVAPADVATDAYVVDVREPFEWADGHIDGAQHIPMGEVPARLQEIPTDREVVVVCHVGARSAQVVQWLNAQGWRTVNLSGGMDAWQRAGRSIVR